MEVSFRNLNGQYECSKRRKHSIDTQDNATPVMEFARLQVEIAKKAISGQINLSDIAVLVNDGIKDVDFKSDVERTLKAKDAAERIERFARDTLSYISSKAEPWRVIIDPPELDIDVNTGTETVHVKGVRLDLIVEHGNSVDGYILRTGKASNKDGSTMSKEDAQKDKKLYMILQYLRRYVDSMMPAGTRKDIAAGYLFLRKRSDRAPSKKTKKQFDSTFYTDMEGNPSDNVVLIAEGYVSGSTTSSMQDKTFEPLFNQFIEGFSPEECSEEQCKECPFNEICHYVHSPISLEDVKKAMDIRAISLSPTQEKIELFKSGYALVNAVPGAGKTLILVLRIIELLMSGVKPEEIVIITFTNSGAEVFKNRIAQYNDDIGTGEDVSGMIATTFNGLGQKILEKEYATFGFATPPRVIDPIQRSAIIANLLNKPGNHVDDLDYRNFNVDMKNCKGPLAVASRVFQIMKQKGYTIFDADKISSEVGPMFCSIDAAKKLATLFDEYNTHLRDKGLVEYADQEMMVLDLLQKDPYYFDQYGWKHILVDECQDTSENQFKLLKYMSNTPSFESLMVVGDDSQSIYGFRDTSPKYFMNFEQEMGLPKGSVHQFYMTDNFRSTPEIIEFANQIVQKNIWKVVKDIMPNNQPGDPVTVKGFIDQKDEYTWIVDKIKERLADGIHPEQIAFIASTRTELLKMADLLTVEDIPSVLLNPERYLENSRVKAGIALAKYFQNTNDTKDISICLNAFFNGDLFTLTDEQIRTAIALKQQEAQEIKALPEPEFRKKYFEILDSFDEDDEIYRGFVDTLQSQPTMAEVFAYCNDFELYGERAEKRREHNYPGVVLTTAHSSKGMEWDVVFNSLTKYDTKDLYGRNQREQQEERRRLLFVSATRARKELYVTGTYVAFGSADNRHYNMFLKEACDIVGEEFDAVKISGLIAARAKERRKQREEERKRLEEEFRKKLEKSA